MKNGRLKVFVSMPFTGKAWEALVQERRDLHVLAQKYDMEIVEQFIGYQGKEDFENKDYNPSFILAKDKNFIKEADVVVADFSTPSIGTDCEVTIAKELFDKKIYGVVPVERRRHMWLRFYCDYFFDTTEEAFAKIQRDFSSGHDVPRVDKRQYDPIAVEYRLVEETPAQRFIYDPAVREFLKEQGLNKRVVVLHDGSGYRARLAKQMGADRVTGIDISHKQTQIAKAEELRKPLGIDYLVLDPYSRDFLSSIPAELVGATDVVLGAFLLDHAMTPDELRIVCRHIAALLHPGGVFFGLSDHESACVPTDPKYGVVISYESEEADHKDGTPRRISIFQKVPGGQKEVLHFHNFIWHQQTMRETLADEGFTDIEFHVPQVSREGIETEVAGFWDTYNDCPTTIAFSAKRS